jgi:hypothetical protein
MGAGREPGYTGIDNLEFMAGARNYNAYLLGQVIHGVDEEAEFTDFGAGSGTFARMLDDRGIRVRCVEPDTTLAGRLSEIGLPVSASLEEAGPIEYLYSLNVLEHIADDRSVVSEIFDRMDAGGKVFFYVPAFMVLYTSMDEKVGHHRRYTKRQLAGLFRRAGFVVDDTRYADSLGFFVTLLFKWFGNDRGDLSARPVKIYDRFVFPLSRMLDHVLFPFFGKNVMIRAHKPGPRARATRAGEA